MHVRTCLMYNKKSYQLEGAQKGFKRQAEGRREKGRGSDVILPISINFFKKLKNENFK